MPTNTNINTNINIETITQDSCFKIKQIIEELERNIEKQQHIIAQTTHYNNSMQSIASAAGMPGPIENTSNTNWIKSLRE